MKLGTKILMAFFAIGLAVGLCPRPAHAQSIQESVVYSFTGGTNGAYPDWGVVTDGKGNFYGTTGEGGDTNCEAPYGCGEVFKVTKTGAQSVLYAFPGGEDGQYPDGAPLVVDSAGNIYGTTYEGGNMSCGVGDGCGTVFKLDPSGHETILYSFAGGDSDGQYPLAGLVGDSAGNLYGTTIAGGGGNSGECSPGCGVIFKLDTTGKETVLYAFSGGADGGSPFAALIRDAQGNLYGTTLGGGGSEDGTVFKLDTSGNESVLHSFTGGSDGASPFSPVVRDAKGNLYGTTSVGGSAGMGTVFKVSAAGQETVLYTFTGGTDGGYPLAGLALDGKSNVYGTTEHGGNASGFSGAGVVFRVETTGNETVLYTFTGGADGGNPAYGSLLLDPKGLLGGTTSVGGDAGYGVVFKVTK
jgi:uncharacterized repeat protein (TIGR03803 family)